MTMGEFRRLTEGLPDDAPLLFYPLRFGGELRLARVERRAVSHEPKSSFTEWWANNVTPATAREAVVIS